MSFFGFSVGDWASVIGIVSAIATFLYWLFSRLINKLDTVINEHLEKNRQDNARNADLVRQNNANQEKLSNAIDDLSKSIENQRFEMLERFGKHEVKLENHDSRITALENFEGFEKRGEK